MIIILSVERKIELISTIFYLVLESIVELSYLLGVLIIVGLTIGLIEKHIHSFLIRSFGTKGILLTAWIGTPVHEIGHLIQCWIWGHRVTRIKLLKLNDPNGVLGFVEHQYNQNSLYQQIGHFFIGIGPVISGISALILGMYVFIPHSFNSYILYIHQQSSNGDGLQMIYGIVSTLLITLFTEKNIIDPLFWLYFYLSICISSHIALSKKDLMGSVRGLLSIFIFFISIKFIASVIGLETHQLVIRIAEVNAYILGYSVIGILFSLIALIISYCLFVVNRKRGVSYGHKKYPYSR